MTFDRYQELGGKLEERYFTAYILLAESEFVKMTGGGALPASDTVETACMMMLEAYDKSANLPLMSRATSFSNDGVSMSLRTTETSQSVIQDALRNVRMLFSAAGISTYGLGVRHRE